MKKFITEVKNTNFIEEINNTKEFDKRKYTFLIGLEIFSMILVALIQYFIRPKKITFLQINDFLLGTLPSLFGAIGYVALVFVIHRIVKIKYHKYKIWKSLLFANLFTVIGFTIWEVIRMALYSFDVNDILMTIFGCFIASFLILIIFYNDLK
ncbi:hypothetical protein D1J36_008145 [Riemerella anatipestifer]|uniref:hypothetical protein n=1 Tax=Riemerella anatipestifer TaxID=34085 RepID=UPI0012AD5C24|nr:hypothetical protein [Riemerella anatipestifer]MDY3363290.1 hypothetical protein [Riemerella anatipestifer]USL95241.1 hypothetical protein D1J36_008145 [Riemerella anatipestifer]